MDENRTISECGKYTLLVGLIKIGEEYVNGATQKPDLNSIKERVRRKVLHVNGHITSLCDYYDREKEAAKDGKKPSDSEEVNSAQNTAINLSKYVIRGEFFVYSVSLEFNPMIECVSNLLDKSHVGDGVCTIIVKMPTNKRRQDFYIKLMLKLISKHSVLLKLTDDVVPFPPRSEKPIEEQTTKEDGKAEANANNVESLPEYFDEDGKAPETSVPGQQYVKAGMNSFSSFSFFNQSTMVLSKYVNSNLIAREDDQIMAERLMREKEKKKRAMLQQGGKR